MKTFLLSFIFLTGSANLNLNQNTYVYICTGPKAEKYHKTDRCRGLNRCSADIKKVSLDEANETWCLFHLLQLNFPIPPKTISWL